MSPCRKQCIIIIMPLPWQWEVNGVVYLWYLGWSPHLRGVRHWCLYVDIYVCVSCVMPEISIWSYKNGRCLRTLEYWLQKASHDTANRLKWRQPAHFLIHCPQEWHCEDQPVTYPLQIVTHKCVRPRIVLKDDAKCRDYAKLCRQCPPRVSTSLLLFSWRSFLY